MTNETEINITTTHKDNYFNANNIIYESEFLSPARKDTNLYQLVKFYNQVYRFGFDLVYFLLLLTTLTLAPIFGGIVAIVDFFFAMLRMFIRPVGKTVADLLGFGSFLRARTTQMQHVIVL